MHSKSSLVRIVKLYNYLPNK